MKYRIYFTNHGYYSQHEFDYLNCAIARAKSYGFQSGIWLGDQLIATYCPIAGIQVIR